MPSARARHSRAGPKRCSSLSVSIHVSTAHSELTHCALGAILRTRLRGNGSHARQRALGHARHAGLEHGRHRPTPHPTLRHGAQRALSLTKQNAATRTGLGGWSPALSTAFAAPLAALPFPAAGRAGSSLRRPQSSTSSSYDAAALLGGTRCRGGESYPTPSSSQPQHMHCFEFPYRLEWPLFVSWGRLDGIYGREPLLHTSLYHARNQTSKESSRIGMRCRCG